MLPSRHFIDLTQPEIAQQLKHNPLVILPAGSVEQHGPHLPTGTDIYASPAIGHAVAERMDGLLLPATPFGVTPMHMPFEGTITLAPDTYQRVVIETCVATAKHGAKYLLILNWHEGNIPSLAIAAEALHREHGMTVLTDIRTIAPTGWYGAPEHATVDKGLRMLNDIADAIAKAAAEIFRLLDAAEGGTAEIKQLQIAG